MDRNLALHLLGDLQLGRLVDDSLRSFPDHAAKLWANFLPTLQGAQLPASTKALVAANLECAVTRHNTKEPKAFNFKLDPKNLEVLRTAHVSFVSLANNHILDYGQQGLLDTLTTLDAAGISHAGAGLSSEDACKPAIVDANGLRLAFLSYSDHYDVWAATNQTSGINFINPAEYDAARIAEDIRAAQQGGAHLVLVFIHWGPNWQWRPASSIRRLGHDFVRSGADVVFGHSSHHVQGIEVFQGSPIVYGAGGFIDDYAVDPDYRNDLGFLYTIKIENGKPVALELVASKICHTLVQDPPPGAPPYVSQVAKATGADKQWVEDKLRLMSMPYGTKVEAAPDGSHLRIPLGSSS